MDCKSFTDILSRRSEHLQDYILRDITPVGSLIGYFETGRWPAQNGVSFTFDKFNRMWPDMAHGWSDVTAGSCVGSPCDPDEIKVGFGFTRDMAKLQEIHYVTDLFCFDQIMTADRAKQQFAHLVENLREMTNVITSNRLLNEQFRIAGHHWLCTTTGLTPFTYTETNDLTALTLSGLPTAGMVPNHLRRRVTYQMNSGALGKNVQNVPPKIEVMTDLDTIWDLAKGDTTVADHWRFNEFTPADKEYWEYGWSGQIGNFMLKAILQPQRWQILANGTLQRVFPYINIAATQGIKAIPNPQYEDAPIQATYITHRRGFRNLVLDNTTINPQMPFAARDFGGKWQWVMNNLTCGTARICDSSDPTTPVYRDVPIAVDNTRGNKGKFIADWKFGTEAQFPEYVECFLHLRAQPCVVATEPCGLVETYVTQDYSSENEPCTPDPNITTEGANCTPA